MNSRPWRLEVSEKSPFRKVAAKTPQRTDIESLFRDLKNRDPKVSNLYAQQADVLREYYNNHLASKDVSIELPTGSGKTLVGLLIAEWRRRYQRERIIYLCPTRQLANQVGQQSERYGIPSRVLVGPKRQLNRQAVNSYRSGDVTAIITYSGLFNTNPEFSDAQTIILDDAHGGESYISSLFSITINREEDPEIYEKIISTFERDLSPDFVASLRSASRPTSFFKPEKVPFGAFYKKIERVKEILDEGAPPSDFSDLSFSWQSIRNNLHACNVFLSWDGILVRPYIPPTLTHKAFAQAAQRVYMSATLGSSGELERITGVGQIERISTPAAYRSRSVGRRLFLFPDMVDDAQGYNPWLRKTIYDAARALILCPTGRQVQQAVELLEGDKPTPKILKALDIENSMDSFSKSKSAALVLSNRYDGLDISSENCRLLVIHGLPTGTNLQEVFLEQRLGLDVLLREREKTRISQAAGRCTRSDTDYAAVIMTGRALLNFCMKRENQLSFNPEIRAEIQFSLRQDVKQLAKLDDMLKSFLAKDDNWSSAEENIGALREQQEAVDEMISQILAKAVSDEVNFSYCLWSGNYKDALKYGKAVTDRLSDSRLSAYRALWYYFTGSAAYAGSATNSEYARVAENSLSRAIQTCRTISWFANALKSMLPENRLRSVANEIESLATEGIADALQDLGSSGPAFLRKMEEIDALLGRKEADKFDRGVAELGTLLGFTSWNPGQQAAPDCVWQLGSDIAYLFEGKSGESEVGPISVDDCRQASGHLKWAKADDRVKACKRIYTILVTPRIRLHKDALPHAKDLYLLKPIDLVQLFERAKGMLSEIRSTMSSEMNEEFKERILSTLVQKELTPGSLQQFLLSTQAL